MCPKMEWNFGSALAVIVAIVTAVFVAVTQ